MPPERFVVCVSRCVDDVRLHQHADQGQDAAVEKQYHGGQPGSAPRDPAPTSAQPRWSPDGEESEPAGGQLQYHSDPYDGQHTDGAGASFALQRPADRLKERRAARTPVGTDRGIKPPSRPAAYENIRPPRANAVEGAGTFCTANSMSTDAQLPREPQ